MKNWSLNLKIAGVLSIFVVACIGISGVGVTKIEQINTTLEQLMGQSVPAVIALKDMAALTNEIRVQEKVLILEDNKENFEKVNLFIEDIEKKVYAQIETFTKYASESDKKVIEDLKTQLQSWKVVYKEIRTLSSEGKDKDAYKLSRYKSREILLEYNAIMDNFIKEKAAAMKAAEDAARDLVSFTRLLIIMVTVSSLLIGITLAFFILRALHIAIKNVIGGLNESASQVATGSQQIASSSEQLSQASTEQASSLEETAASVEEMHSMISKNTENAMSAVTISNKSQDVVNQGKEVIQKMIQSMEAINTSSEKMSETIKVIEQIDKKTKVINEIVNKTELLSFNASVEAARAGEHGKGFAVVAEEVGNLARMSGAAAEEIAILLEESISKVNQMVIDTKKNVETGAQVARECGELFEEVVENVSSVSNRATEISSASQEQARGISEITKAMSQLDQMTQQNASTSEECAMVAEELSAQSQSLKDAVNQLIYTVNGRNGSEQFVDNYSAPRANAPKQKATNNLVHLKSNAASGKKSGSPVILKKTGSGTPNYDSEGFTDV